MKPETSSRRRIAIFGIALPAAALTAALVLTLLWIPRLPNPVAVHWAFSGTPNGFGPPATYLVITALAWLLWLAIAIPNLRLARKGRYWATSRWNLTLGTWIACLLSGVTIGGQIVQLDLPTSAEAPSVAGPLLWSLVGATALALVTYAGLPKGQPQATRGGQITPTPLRPGEKAAWLSEATSPKWITIPVFVVGSASLVAGVAAALGRTPDAWPLLGVGAILLIVLGAFTTFKVSVGSEGLVVRSYLGWPGKRVALARIRSVELVEVDPIAQWGGYGWRSRPGGSALVTRKGVGLQVTMTSGKTFTVTAEDSAGGARLLAALIADANQTQDGEAADADSH